jgi:hypothetical protein
MHLATLSVVTLASLAIVSVGNSTVRAGKSLPKAFLDLVALTVMTVFWFGFFHILNS